MPHWKEPLAGDDVFRIDWRAALFPRDPVADVWIAVRRTPDGSWWFGAYLVGWFRIGGGAERAAAFARWLLEPPPRGRYEKEFTLIEWERQAGDGPLAEGQLLHVELLLGRDEEDGPESLMVVPAGDTGPPLSKAFMLFEGVVYEPADRAILDQAAAALLASSSTTGHLGPN